MMKNYIIESERLGFRNWKESDLELLFSLNTNSKVMKYFPGLLTVEENNNFYKKMKENIERDGYGFFCVEEKTSGNFIGLIGINKILFDGELKDKFEIGWRLLPEYWRKGYAAEGAKKMIKYGFEELNLKEIFAFTYINNVNSFRVMERAGMRKIKEFNHPRLNESSWLLRHVLYSIKK